jgi:hypothetical protein
LPDISPPCRQVIVAIHKVFNTYIELHLISDMASAEIPQSVASGFHLITHFVDVILVINQHQFEAV